MIDPRIERLASEALPDLKQGHSTSQSWQQSTPTKATPLFVPDTSNSGSSSQNHHNSSLLLTATSPHDHSCSSEQGPVERYTFRVQRPLQGDFGFAVKGRGVMRVYTIFRSSPLYGMLEVDDRLTSVNGVDASTLSHKGLVELLASIPRGGAVEIVVERPIHLNESGWSFQADVCVCVRVVGGGVVFRLCLC